MHEPELSRAHVDDRLGAELLEPGRVHALRHDAIDAPERGGGETGCARERGQGVQSGPKRHGQALRHGKLRVAGRRELERIVGAAAGQLGEPAELRSGERLSGALEEELGEMPLCEAPDLDSVDRVPVPLGEPRELVAEARS